MRELNIQPPDSVELGNLEAVKQGVKSGLGIAFISRLAVSAELKSKTLVAVGRKVFAGKREMKIVYRKGRHLSHVVLAFIDLANQIGR